MKKKIDKTNFYYNVRNMNPRGRDGWTMLGPFKTEEELYKTIKESRDEYLDMYDELDQYTFISHADQVKIETMKPSNILKKFGGEEDIKYNKRLKRCNECFYFIDRNMQYCKKAGQKCKKFISIDDYWATHKPEESVNAVDRPSALTNACIKWIQDYFKETNCSKAVIGISGGKDSTVVAYLCVKALGKENVIGVLMPNGEQKDIDDSMKVVKNLGIDYKIININNAFVSIIDKIGEQNTSEQARTNLAPRLRMATLYAVAQSVGGRVVGTGNLCERMLGYYTLWGDGVCDMNPIGNFLVSDVIDVGRELGVPDDLLLKAPSDGLTGKTDEESLGFTYEEVERVIKYDDTPNAVKIKARFDKQRFKRMMTDIPMFYDENLCETY